MDRNKADYGPYLSIIGLEIHVELATKSKMFCGCRADWFGQKPNSLTCPVCLGLPGALPVPNKKAVEWTIMLGMALNCKIAHESKFDRKNYFYPDLPKGYQISQHDRPIATAGSFTLSSKGKNEKMKTKTIHINRVHLEEDTGKLMHKVIAGQEVSLIDFNRSGIPLVEIVTNPDIRDSAEAVTFLKELRRIIRYLSISDADMEKGSMRIEPNVSVLKTTNHKPQTNKSSLPGYKVEIKNINSFKFAKKAIDYEIHRQIKLLTAGKQPLQETRGWDEKRQKTVAQRRKEGAHDYRYFPEPDIPPMRFNQQDLEEINKQIPELPTAKLNRFMQEYRLNRYNAAVLMRTRESADYFEAAVRQGRKHKLSPKTIANWIINKKRGVFTKVSPAKLIQTILFDTKKENLSQQELEKAIDSALAAGKRAAADYRAGKRAALDFLIGLVMRKTQGRADAQETARLLQQRLVDSG